MTLLSHPDVAESRQTCWACPEQYEGKLHDGRWFYFRYRSGWASLAIGEEYDAVMGRRDVDVAVGHGLQGVFDDDAQRDGTFAELLAQALRLPGERAS